MLLERWATKAVLDALEWAPVVLVEGPRQAGKSVLVRDLVGQKRPADYVTLDDAVVLAGAREDPQGFVTLLPDPVIVDEVQRAPGIFLPIKLVVDADRRPGRFMLTGSANVLLMPKVSDSLAGRMRIVTLWPLSQGEIDGEPPGFVEALFDAAPLPRVEGTLDRIALARRITRGGFPEAVSLPEGAPRDGWMRDYATTLLERDVRDLAAIGDRVVMPRLLRILAARSGTLLNVSDLSRATGIARATLDRYLAVLNRTFVVRLIPAWSGDVARRLIKAPKVLVADSGLAAHLVGLDAERLLSDPDRLGPLLDTFVGTELLKQLATIGSRVELMHFRDSRGNEVDWVLEDATGRIVGVEVKSTATPSQRDFKGLRALAASVGERFCRGVLLHGGTASVPMGEGMWALPIEALWRTKVGA